MNVMGMFLALSTMGGIMLGHASEGLSKVGIVQQNSQCTGVVKDASGMTVIGASVVVKGTPHGTVTDMDGRFTLDGVKRGDVIVISYVGYQDQQWHGMEPRWILC